MQRLVRPTPANTVFLCCDVQTGFQNRIKFFPHLLNTANKLLGAANLMDIPVIVTEQYPKALGQTCTELDISKCILNHPKTKFSMLAPPVVHCISSLKAENAVLFGLEVNYAEIVSCLCSANGARFAARQYQRFCCSRWCRQPKQWRSPDCNQSILI